MTPNKSLFNLIEIFSKNKTRKANKIVDEAHCEHKQLHDYYCDAEKPFIIPN